MSSTKSKKSSGPGPGAKGVPESISQRKLQLAAIGMEAEFALFIDNVQEKPEDIFGDPRAFVRGNLFHRVGTSYHLPTGGAVYFDTGVIEVATPVIEIEHGCAARAGRSLWEAILYIRNELDAWEQKTGHGARLVGFSTHYNISFDVPHHEQSASRTVEKLAYLLAYILPAPVMMLATNPRSTGVGVRPRGDRIEITVDFTPSASLMIATGALITGIVREVMKWPSFEMEMLDRAELPVIIRYKPMPHTSRKGWLARFDCYPQNPFTVSPNAPVWMVTYGRPAAGKETEHLSLREIAQRIFAHFRPDIRRIAELPTFRLITRVLSGLTPSLLELPDRPTEYEDVGRLCLWDNLFPERMISRSRYERVLIRAIAGKRLWLNGYLYTPTGLRGWSEVVFRRDADGTRHIFPIDFLLHYLKNWG